MKKFRWRRITKKWLIIGLLDVIAIFIIIFGIYMKTTQVDNERNSRRTTDLIVVLDPGHGGQDPGAVVGDIYEKDIDLTVAILVREKLLEYDDIQVLMTRDTDEFIPLSDRAKYANQQGADLFVSIHANALEDMSCSGIMTFCHPSKTSGQAPAAAIQAALIEATGAVDRNVRSEQYTVLTETKMAAVLVETGFMTNPEELEQLTDPAYQELLANGIVNGILAYTGR